MDSGFYWCKASYFDTSALVKLVVDIPSEELGRDAVQNYYWSHIASVYATPYCVAETFGVFKRLFIKNQITDAQYIEYIRKFSRQFLGLNLRQDQMSVLSPAVLAEAERLVRDYAIDFVDCLQLVTIMRGKYGVLGPNSKSILVTADGKLAKVARAENVRVWECRTEPSPDAAMVAGTL